MAAKILTFMFYPWVDACLKAAYNEYLDKHGSKKLERNLTEEYIIKHFIRYHIDDYMKIAWNKHCVRIIFAPWTITTSPELYEHKFD